MPSLNSVLALIQAVVCVVIACATAFAPGGALAAAAPAAILATLSMIVLDTAKIK